MKGMHQLVTFAGQDAATGAPSRRMPCAKARGSDKCQHATEGCPSVHQVSSVFQISSNVAESVSESGVWEQVTWYMEPRVAWLDQFRAQTSMGSRASSPGCSYGYWRKRAGWRHRERCRGTAHPASAEL